MSSFKIFPDSTLNKFQELCELTESTDWVFTKYWEGDITNILYDTLEQKSIKNYPDKIIGEQ